MFIEKLNVRAEDAKKNLDKSLFSVKVLVKWLAISVGIGGFIGAVSSIFGHMLIWANDYRGENPWILFLLPLGGLFIVFSYRVLNNSNDKGTNTIIASIHSSGGIPFKVAPLIFVSTFITHLCGGSAGREGAAIQLGGSIANQFGKLYNLNENNQRIIIMCGMSAGFSALFGTPMAAAIFSLEVVSIGIMHYSALGPCVTSAMMAHFVAEFFEMPPEKFMVAIIPEMNPVLFFKMVLFAGLTGVVSILFCIALHSAGHVNKRVFGNAYIRIAAAGSIIVLLTMILQDTKYLGSGMEIIEHIFHGESVDWYTFLLKILFTALTLGAGFKGGEIVPSFCIGAAFGCTVAALFGVPVTLAAACGMVGVFCGVTNCPITSLLISFELFGFEGMPYYLTTIAVSYMLSGYYGLYQAQKIMYSKTETNFVNKEAH